MRRHGLIAFRMVQQRMEDAVAAFKAILHGTLQRSGDTGYDVTCKIWNAMIDKRLALIARCAGVADVISAVHFVRTHDLLNQNINPLG